MQIDGETVKTVTDFILGGSKITADGDCSHEIKKCLLLGIKAMTNPDSVLKNRDITLLTKVYIVKAMVFPVHPALAQRLKRLPGMQEARVRSLSPIPESGISTGEGNGSPLQYSCLENPMGRSLVGYSPWVCRESDMTEQLHSLTHFCFIDYAKAFVWITINCGKF